jgi:FtsH-binding integral membrane protein
MAKRPTGAQLWLIAFPLLAGGGAFVKGGIGPGVFCYAIAAVAAVFAARVDRRSRVSTHHEAGDRAKGAAVQFRRWWLAGVVAVAVGVVMVYVSEGTKAGTVALALGVAFVCFGAVALLVMRQGGDKA